MAEVAPEMIPPLVRLVPSFFHWNEGAGVPLAAAVKVTVSPQVTVWLTGGWEVITGGVPTVRVALLLVSEAIGLVATTA